MTNEQLANNNESGIVTINDREYVMNKLTFEERRSVFAYMTKISGQLDGGDFSFLDNPEYKKIEKILYRCFTLDGDIISNKTFEKYTEDYMPFIVEAFATVSYPFLKGGLGG